jgi:hypothetical protein
MVYFMEIGTIKEVVGHPKFSGYGKCNLESLDILRSGKM